MVALLVAMAIMAIFMSVAMPVWRQANQREREAELIWRGQQYDRAIQLFRKKSGAPGPPSVDILIKQRFLRKKYKDPITNADFELKPVGPAGMTNVPQGANQRLGLGSRPSGSLGSGQQPGTRQSGTSEEQGTREQQQNVQQPKRAEGQLIGGVRSKSTARSIRVLNGRNRYDQWEFAYVPYGTKAQNVGPGSSPQQPGTSPRPGVGSPQPSPR